MIASRILSPAPVNVIRPGRAYRADHRDLPAVVFLDEHVHLRTVHVLGERFFKLVSHARFRQTANIEHPQKRKFNLTLAAHPHRAILQIVHSRNRNLDHVARADRIVGGRLGLLRPAFPTKPSTVPDSAANLRCLERDCLLSAALPESLRAVGTGAFDEQPKTATAPARASNRPREEAAFEKCVSKPITRASINL